MFIVRKTLDGDLKWSETHEIESLEVFALNFNKRLIEIGVKGQRYSVVSKHQVDYRDADGKLIESYHACEKNPYRLI
jgi:hypothetical protein